MSSPKKSQLSPPRHSKSLNETSLSQLKKQSNFFSPFFHDSTLQINLISPAPSFQPKESSSKENENPTNEISSLTRQENTMKIHIITPVPFRTNSKKTKTSNLLLKPEENHKKSSFGLLDDEINRLENLANDRFVRYSREISNSPDSKAGIEEKLEKKIEEMVVKKAEQRKEETEKLYNEKKKTEKGLKLSEFLEIKKKELRKQKLDDFKSDPFNNNKHYSSDFTVKTKQLERPSEIMQKLIEKIPDNTKLQKNKIKKNFQSPKKFSLPENFNQIAKEKRSQSMSLSEKTTKKTEKIMIKSLKSEQKAELNEIPEENSPYSGTLSPFQSKKPEQNLKLNKSHSSEIIEIDDYSSDNSDSGDSISEEEETVILSENLLLKPKEKTRKLSQWVNHNKQENKRKARSTIGSHLPLEKIKENILGFIDNFPKKPDTPSDKDKELAEKLLNCEYLLEKNVNCINIKTFLWVKTIIRPQDCIFKISASLLNLIRDAYPNQKFFDIRNWKRIQNHFIDPTELLTILTNFREKALNNRISQENEDFSKEIYNEIQEFDEELIQTRLFHEFVLPIKNFLESAYKFLETIRSIQQKIGCSLENSPKQEVIPTKYSLSPKKKSIENKKKQIKTCRLENTMKLSVKKPQITSSLIESNKKIRQKHCFFYEITPEIDEKWKQLLKLRGEMAKLFWDEERRVKKELKQREFDILTQEIQERQLIKQKENELKIEKKIKEKQEEVYWKNKNFKDEKEAKFSEEINNKIKIIDDLSRSIDTSRSQKKINEKLKNSDFKEKKEVKMLEKVENDVRKYEKKSIIKEKESWKLIQLNHEKAKLEKNLNSLRKLLFK